MTPREERSVKKLDLPSLPTPHEVILPWTDVGRVRAVQGWRRDVAKKERKGRGAANGTEEKAATPTKRSDCGRTERLCASSVHNRGERDKMDRQRRVAESKP
jgi:hypothetical protein